MSATVHDHHSLDNQTTKVEHNNYDLESGHGHANGNNMQGGAPLGRQISIQLSNEQYEKLFLNPGGRTSKGDASRTLGNTTALGLASFLLCLTPFSCWLMGWASTTTQAAAVAIGAFYWVGGLGLTLAAIGEYFLGNTFPMTVFATFGGYWFAFAFLLQPTQDISTAAASATVDYNAGIAIYLIWWAVLVLVYLVAALRTNVVFVVLFTCLDITFWLLIGLYLNVSKGQVANVGMISKAAGAFGFLTCMCGWYLFIVIVLGSTGVPIGLPVGDLSSFMSPKQKKAREE